MAVLDAELLLFSVDGLLGQCGLARTQLEMTGASTAGVDSIMAAGLTLRELITTAVELDQLKNPEDAPEDDGICRHPEDKHKRMNLSGGHYVITCTACDEIIAQS